MVQRAGAQVALSSLRLMSVPAAFPAEKILKGPGGQAS